MDIFWIKGSRFYYFFKKLSDTLGRGKLKTYWLGILFKFSNDIERN